MKTIKNKTISFNLSKKLNESGVLDGIETEYNYRVYIDIDEVDTVRNDIKSVPWKYPEYKTLTLEEAIELIWKQMCQMKLLYPNAWKWLLQTMYEDEFRWDTLIEVFEQFLEYLLDNNLLNKPWRNQ